MKRLLLVFEGINYPQTAIDFVVRLHQRAPISLAAVFVPKFDLSTVWSYGATDGPVDFIPLVSASEAALIHNNVKAVSELCEKKKIPLEVHKEFDDIGLDKLQLKSRFADLVILGSGSLNDKETGFETEDLAQLVHHIECPVLVIPDDVVFPEQLIVAYDGSESSLFSLKQFVYLFEELTALPTTIANIGEESAVPLKEDITTLATAHFKNFNIESLQFEIGLFSMWAREHKRSLVICGAFGRSGLSNLFRKSFIMNILESKSIPLFIAHK